MRDYPKHLNTKQDYGYVIENFPREKWEKDLQALLETRWAWMPIGELADGEAGVFVAGEKAVAETENADGTVTRTQYEKKINPTAEIFKIGFTVVEVEELLK